MNRLAASVSVLDYVVFGASMAMRSYASLGASVSVLDFLHLGASISLRSIARLGSSFSLFGQSRFGSTISVLDFLHLGSTLSLRSFARLGAAFAVFCLKIWVGVVRFGLRCPGCHVVLAELFTIRVLFRDFWVVPIRIFTVGARFSESRFVFVT